MKSVYPLEALNDSPARMVSESGRQLADVDNLMQHVQHLQDGVRNLPHAPRRNGQCRLTS